jgi:hypothetical protein
LIVERDVFQAKYGHGDELVAVLKESGPLWDARGVKHRILTDVTGPFFTVVLELEWPDQVPLTIAHEVLFTKPEFIEWFSRTVPLTESGRRELYNVAE